MKMSIKLKDVRRARRRMKWNMESLKRDKILFQRCVEDAVKNNEGMDVNQKWLQFKKVDDQEIEQVSSFKYLGSLISENGRCLVDVKTIGLR